jgi:hypothetical protein
MSIEFREGDIVLYNDPDTETPLNNMITRVLKLFAGKGTALIRGRGDTPDGSTTAVVSIKQLQKLKVNPLLPLQVPGEPVECKTVPGTNAAVWQQIPLEWFDYSFSSRPPDPHRAFRQLERRFGPSFKDRLED